MTNNLENLLTEMQIKRKQCVDLEQQRDHKRDQYKQADTLYETAVTQYAQLQAVFDYCLIHDCDETYARMMLSDASSLKQHVKQNENFMVNSISGMLYSKTKHSSIMSSQPSKTAGWFDRLLGRC